MADKCAFITGAGDGIGKGIAFELAKEGYNIMIHSATNIKKAEKTCEEIRKKYDQKAFCVQADLRESESASIIFDVFDSYYKQIDIFVNNAGITSGAPFLKMPIQIIDEIYNINFRAAYLCTQQAALRMVRNKTKGSIVIITSNLQEYLVHNMSVYGPVKRALTRLAEHESMELAQYGIRVNAIAPGYVDSTERMKQHVESSKPYIPLKRMATIEEIGQLVVYITSSKGAFITGSCMTIDGGASNQRDPNETFYQHLNEELDE
jgi:NAD(P)-dependent dehydrogenase (short-subunit alcohol dehydrogenase family)